MSAQMFKFRSWSPNLWGKEAASVLARWWILWLPSIFLAGKLSHSISNQLSFGFAKCNGLDATMHYDATTEAPVHERPFEKRAELKEIFKRRRSQPWLTDWQTGALVLALCPSSGIRGNLFSIKLKSSPWRSSDCAEICVMVKWARHHPHKSHSRIFYLNFTYPCLTLSKPK